MAKKKSSSGKGNTKGTRKKSAKKNSLVANINRRKKAGKSRSKKKSTISKESYEAMEEGWGKKGTS